MAEKFAIYAGEPMATLLTGYEDQRSGRINQVCADYLTFVSELAPELTLGEWCAVCDALNGLFMPPGDVSTVRFAWAEIADCEGLGEKWGIDQAALASRLRAMPLPNLLALAEVNRRFWADAGVPEQPLVTLRRAGARILDAERDGGIASRESGKQVNED